MKIYFERIQMEITNNTQLSKFTVIIDNYEAYLAYKIKSNNIIDLQHTFVPKELTGKGIGSKLIEYALNYSKKNSLEIIPSCSFVKKYLDKKT